MKEWSIGWRSPEIYPTRAVLSVSEHPWWSFIPEWVAETVDTLVGHRWCSPPELLWKIPLSLRKAEDGVWKLSVADLLFRSFQYLMSFAWSHKTLEYEVDLSEEFVAKHGLIDPFEELEKKLWPSDFKHIAREAIEAMDSPEDTDASQD